MRVTDLILRGTREQLEGNDLTKGLNIQALLSRRSNNPSNNDFIPLLRSASASSSVGENARLRGLRKEVLKKAREERVDFLRRRQDSTYRREERDISNRIISSDQVNPTEVNKELDALLNNQAFMGLEEGVEAAVTPAATPASLLQDSDSVFGTRPDYIKPSANDFEKGRPLFLEEDEFNFDFTDFTDRQLGFYDTGKLDTLPSVEQDDLIKSPQSISDLFKTKAARDFQYESGVEGMESPGFRLTPELQARFEAIEEFDYLNRAARNIEADADAALMDRPPLGVYGDDLPAMQKQEVLDQIGYSETAHTRANLTTATEAVTEGSTSGNFVPGTLAFNETSSANSLLGMGDAAGLGGIGASMGLGAVLGGATSYATGGEFSEGAIMGGLAGGGINIGARAIRANQSGIESFLQRKVLGNAMTENRLDNAQLISTMAKNPEAMGNLGFMQRAAANRLTTDPNKSAGLQSRHMVVGGSMLAGVAFTGRRNDKRRGFNAHRGNRI